MRKETHERRYRYDSQNQLKLLVALLAENNIQLSVVMRAVVPEEFDKLRKKILSAKTIGYPPEYIKSLIPDGGTIYDAHKIHERRIGSLLEQMAEQAGRVKVLPFSRLICKFDFYWGPEVEHEFPYDAKGNEAIDVPYFRGAVNPLHIVGGWRFYSIWMREARNPIYVKLIKDLVTNTEASQYKITSISAGLNPRDWGGGCDYTGGTDYDARMSAGDGVIIISGVDIDKVDVPIRKIGVREEPKQLASGVCI